MVPTRSGLKRITTVGALVDTTTRLVNEFVRAAGETLNSSGIGFREGLTG
jgi:hypothetical protein